MVRTLDADRAAVPGAHQRVGRAVPRRTSSPTGDGSTIQSLARTWIGAAIPPPRPRSATDARETVAGAGRLRPAQFAVLRRACTATCPQTVSHLTELPVIDQAEFWAANTWPDNRLLTGPLTDAGRLQDRRHHRRAEVLPVDAHRARRLGDGLRRGHGPGRAQAGAPGGQPVLRRGALRRFPLHRGALHNAPVDNVRLPVGAPHPTSTSPS